MAFKVEVETAPDTGAWNDYTSLVMADSLVVVSQGGADAGTSTALFRDIAGTAVVLPECGYRVTDGTTVIFRGKIKRRGKTEKYTNPRGKWYSITAQDATCLLVDDVVDSGGLRTGSRSDKTEVEWLLTTFGTKGVAGGSTVQSTGTISRDIDYTGMNLFEALVEAGKWLGVKFYVGTDLLLHWYVTETNSAPFNLSDNPNGTTTFGYDGFDFPDDSLDLTNAVFVIGAEGVGEWVPPVGTWPTASHNTYGRKESAFVDNTLADSAARQAAGNAILAKYSVPRGPIKVTIYKPGLKADMTIEITNSTWAISAVTYRIAEVTASINGQTATFKYDVSLQDAPITLQNVIGGGFDRVGQDIDRSTNNAVAYAEQFLIGRVKVVDVLPTLPDPDFPIGAQVFLTVDEKLYRNPDDVAWTAAVWLPDGIGKITGTQIADDAISTPHIAANSIDAGMIQAGAIGVDQLAANSVVAGKIAAGAIGAEALAAEIVLADTLLTTGLSGRRVEIDDAGIRAYSAAEQLLVNIPTVGTDPVSVVGEIEAASLVATGAAELRGANVLNAGSSTTLQVGVVDPPTAPTVAITTPSATLASAPAQPGSGICYDALGGTGLNTPVYYIGADPTIGNLLDVAYEYRVSDGALLRTIQKTGTTQTITGATLGSTSHVADTTQAYSGTSNSQIGTPLTFPARDNIIVRKVSAYLAGYGGAATCRAAIWNTSGTSLRESADFSAAERTFSNGNDVRYERSLTSGLSVAPSATIWAGFLHTSSGDGFFYSRDDGSGKTTKRGDGLAGSMTGIETDSASKPNVYVIYDYDVDSSLEGAMTKIVGVARITGSDILWVLDSSGILYKYTLSTGAYVGKVDLSANIAGTKANAGLFYDGTNLIITTATGVTGTDQVRFVKCNATTGAWISNHATTGNAINGSTATVRGGYTGGGYYYVALNGGVRIYDDGSPDWAYHSEYNFGSSSECLNGCSPGASGNGIGYAVANPTKVWLYTSWMWTTGGPDFWVCYSWYDITGTTHETKVSPRVKITPGQRRVWQVSNPAIPGASTEPPDRVRIYAIQSASDPGGTGYKLQVTDALTTRQMPNYSGSGGANSGSNTFPVGTPAVIQSVTTDPGWALKGDGAMRFAATSFPGSPSNGDICFRSDLFEWFQWDSTLSLWLCCNRHELLIHGGESPTALPLTANSQVGGRAPIPAVGIRTIGYQINTYSGGTPSSQYFTVAIRGMKSDGSAGTDYYSISTQNDTASRWTRRSGTGTPATLLPSDSPQVNHFDVMTTAITGAASVYPEGIVVYRHVG